MRVKISPAIDTDLGVPIRTLLSLGFTRVSHTGVEVHVKRSTTDQFSGHAYYELPSIANVAPSTKWLVTLALPGSLTLMGDYPRIHKDWRLKRAPELKFERWEHEFIHLVAHEAGHIREFARKNSKHPHSELRAERWAARTLDRVSNQLVP